VRREHSLGTIEARRLALAAQGFDRPRPQGAVGAKLLARTIRQLGLVQIDYVNVVAPAHYLVLFSRLGPYSRERLHEIVYRRREFTEQWAHEASIVPVETWPLLRHRMEARRLHPFRFQGLLRGDPRYTDKVLAEVRARGPLHADDLPAPLGGERRIPGAWVGTMPRAALESHFARGFLAVADRLPNFSRTYDLAERVVPAEHHGRAVEREEAQRELLLQAARAHGVGTSADLADYFRMPVREARPRLAELVESGQLCRVTVEGWREPAFIAAGTRPPRRAIAAAALLAPFDPLIWFRPRTARLFGFDFRFEIFVPEAQRRWGKYVLPFLLGERLVARVDLKADRERRRLLVLSARAEPHADRGVVAPALAAELDRLAAWLGLDSVAVGRRGDLARALMSARPSVRRRLGGKAAS
jgi:uncharacterized protein YcaQ